MPAAICHHEKAEIVPFFSLLLPSQTMVAILKVTLHLERCVLHRACLLHAFFHMTEADALEGDRLCLLSRSLEMAALNESSLSPRDPLDPQLETQGGAAAGGGGWGSGMHVPA